MPQRQDYLLRLLEDLGKLVLEATRFREAGRHDAALLTILQAQERLFARPAREFMARSVEQQLHLLAVGESDVNAADKCLAYANLLIEAGVTYQARGQAQPALGACQIALQIIELAGRRFPDMDSAGPRARATTLLAAAPENDLKAQVVALLNRLAAPA